MRTPAFATTARCAPVLVLAGLLALAPVAAAQDTHGAPAAAATADRAPADHGNATDSHGDDSHGNPVVEMLAKLLNFGILAGTLVYFARSPLAQYLASRKTQIRSDLVKASDMKAAAAEQLAAVEQKLAALPGELQTLRQTGAAEVAAEETRIRAMADHERTRLLQQMQREIDLHGRAAERDLVRLAADRAVTAATRTIERTMTDADHARLQERYVAMVGK